MARAVAPRGRRPVIKHHPFVVAPFPHHPHYKEPLRKQFTLGSLRSRMILEWMFSVRGSWREMLRFKDPEIR